MTLFIHNWLIGTYTNVQRRRPHSKGTGKKASSKGTENERAVD